MFLCTVITVKYFLLWNHETFSCVSCAMGLLSNSDMWHLLYTESKSGVGREIWIIAVKLFTCCEGLDLLPKSRLLEKEMNARVAPEGEHGGGGEHPPKLTPPSLTPPLV